MGLRNSGKYVKLTPREFIRALKEVQDQAFALGIELGMSLQRTAPPAPFPSFGGGCGNPNCPIHGTGRDDSFEGLASFLDSFLPPRGKDYPGGSPFDASGHEEDEYEEGETISKGSESDGREDDPEPRNEAEA